MLLHSSGTPCAHVLFCYVCSNIYMLRSQHSFVVLMWRCAEIASLEAEIAEVTSRRSFEMNKIIASNCEIMKSLISVIWNSRWNVSMAACNTILDISTTTIENIGYWNLLWENIIELSLLTCSYVLLIVSYVLSLPS